jgi:hypothetical protein
MKASLLLLVPLLSPLAGHATATLMADSATGDSAAVVATCLQGSYPFGSDIRGCADDKSVDSPSGSTTVDTAAWATYSGGNVGKAAASASLGTLKAEAQASIPSADAAIHNLQSRGIAQMWDTLQASSSLGSLYNNYLYTVNIAGVTTPGNGTYDLPSIKAFAYAQVTIRNNANGDILASQYWETSDVSLGGGVISGTLMGVPANTELSLFVYLEANAGVVTDAIGQSAYASADYIDTLHFHLDALTPGANTVSEFGHDYASPVPESSTACLMAFGLAGVALRRRRVRP